MTVGDTKVEATDTLTITLSSVATNGTLTGLTGTAVGGDLTVAPAATHTSELDAAVFHPTNPTTAATFALSDLNGAFPTPTTNSATVVTNTVVGDDHWRNWRPEDHEWSSGRSVRRRDRHPSHRRDRNAVSAVERRHLV